MRVFIAEKPSLARAIASSLPGPHRKNDGYIETGKGDVVTWCFGHLLEQAKPEAYNDNFKTWRLADLPIIPETWKLSPRKDAQKQLRIIRNLLSKASSAVHAGDPDREGQLLVDEVLEWCKFQKPVQRLLVSDLNPQAITKALQAMRSNTEFRGLSQSALARSHADWLFGINLTRAYTLLAQRLGYRGVLSVGRVQSPVLGLVVRRDLERENFVSKPYFEVEAHISHEKKTILAKWKPSEACAPYQDEEGRVITKALAENVVSRIKGESATVTNSESKTTKEAPPLPFSLSALQIEAAEQYGLSAQEVLTHAQSLYEKHQAITYPRSDSKHLPEEHFLQAAEVCAAIGNNAESLASFAGGADLHIRSRAWDDKKVGAHHAIIPTPKKLTGPLSGKEARVYELIARRYLMQFAQPAVYATAKLAFQIGPGTFIASGKTRIEEGWRALQAKKPKQAKDKYVPQIEKGTVLTCKKGSILEKKTEPPKAFTDATLLKAMTTIARYVQDKDLRAILKETDGLGTEATRAGILEILFKRNFLTRSGKTITSTTTGRALVAALPADITLPDRTAQWEQIFSAIADGGNQYQELLSDLASSLKVTLSEAATKAPPSSLRNLPSPTPRKAGRKKQSRKRSAKRKSAQ